MVLPQSYMLCPDLTVSFTNCLQWGFIGTERSSKVGDVAVGFCVSRWAWASSLTRWGCDRPMSVAVTVRLRLTCNSRNRLSDLRVNSV